MNKRMLLAVIMAFFTMGTLMLGRGMTGMIVSQSCCIDYSCTEEYVCGSAEPYPISPAEAGQSTEMFYMGLGLIAASLVATLALGRPEFPWMKKRIKKGK